MTDLEKVIYLDKHIGKKVHFYHRTAGDCTAKILSANRKERTFSCVLKNSDTALIISFDEVTEFGFRENNPPNIQPSFT